MARVLADDVRLAHLGHGHPLGELVVAVEPCDLLDEVYGALQVGAPGRDGHLERALGEGDLEADPREQASDLLA